MIINCKNCKKDKTSELFGKDRSRKNGYHPYCKVCKSLINNEWAERNKSRRAEYHRQNADRWKQNKANNRLIKLYGITLDDYQNMLQKQNHICSICKSVEKTKNRTLSVDHDHKTNKIRELLCQRCNAALGMLEEDPRIIGNLLDYIKKYKGDN